MWRKSQVEFLGGGESAMTLCYPAGIIAICSPYPTPISGINQIPVFARIVAVSQYDVSCLCPATISPDGTAG